MLVLVIVPNLRERTMICRPLVLLLQVCCFLFFGYCTPGDSYYIKGMIWLSCVLLLAACYGDLKVHYELSFCSFMQMIYQPLRILFFIWRINLWYAQLNNCLIIRWFCCMFYVYTVCWYAWFNVRIWRSVLRSSLFLFPCLSYYFNYFYRLDDKTQFNNDFGNFGSIITSVGDFMDIYQRPWKFDYFTSIYRSPIV